MTTESFNYKSLTDEQLNWAFRDVPFKISPRWHQKVSLAFAMGECKDHRVAYLHGVRTGKTLCSLFTAQLWNCKKILVVCPTSAFVSWEEDIPKGTDYTYTFLLGDKKDRHKLLNKDYNIYITHWDGLKVLFAKLKRVVYKDKFGVIQNKKEWRIDENLLNKHFDCFIIDEAHRCNNYLSLQSDICLALSRRIKSVIALTGTLIDKSMLEAFNIYKVVDLGKSLGLDFFRYRREFFYKYSKYEWKLKKGADKKILNKISGITISFDREECIDIPKEQKEIFYINPSSEYFTLLNKIVKNENIVDLGNGIKIDSEHKPQVLVELCGGFFYYDDESGNRQIYYLKENAKLDALIDMILDTKSKGIIFHRYIEEGNMIETTFKKNNISCVSVRGGQKPEDRMTAIKKFSNNPDTWMIAHPKTASEGWDGSSANIVIYYSPLGSPRLIEQCSGRILGDKQKQKCLILDFVMKHSVDEKTIKNRSEHFNLVKTAKEFLKEYGGRKEQ